MRKLSTVVLVLSILLGIVVLPASVTAQDNDPEAVLRAMYEAFNAGDVDGGMAYYAEDAVLVLLPPPPGRDSVFRGKDAIREWKTEFAGRNGLVEFTDFHVNRNTASWTAQVVEDVFRELGVFPVEFSGVAVVQNGLIKSETWVLSEMAQAALAAAMALETTKTPLRRSYEEIFNEKNLDVLDEFVLVKMMVQSVNDECISHMSQIR